MNKNTQTNENGADKSPSPLEQQALLRDVDYCFGLFLNRLKDEEAEGNRKFACFGWKVTLCNFWSYYTKYYTVAIFNRKSLIYIFFTSLDFC